MKNNFKLMAFAAIFVALFTSSCTVRQVTADYLYLSKPQILIKPQIADIDIQKKKVEATITVKTSLYKPDPIEAAKNLALKEAIKNSNADLLVQPTYDVNYNNNVTTATVTGYPATFKEFREFKPTDTAAVMAYSRVMYGINQSGSNEANKPKEKMISKGSGGAKALAGVLAVVTVLTVVISIITY
ncbi:MAG: hypothetical protein MH472_02095 [Bacteroidia bacterium]|nr:hypothetical protein [Bacteroidia bacterium]